MISLIAAMDKKRGIGKNGSIPWYIPEDFKHFKDKTLNHPIIMGRRTFESIGRVLPGRANIIISKKLKDKVSIENVLWADSLDAAIELAKKEEGSSEIFIIGGGQIYKQALDQDKVDKIYLTIIDSEFAVDTYFPEHNGFKETIRQKKENDNFKYSFVEYVKV